MDYLKVSKIIVYKNINQNQDRRLSWKKNIYLNLIDITLNALNHLRNKLLEDGIDTDTVDDLILKILDTPSKKRGFTLSNLKGINTR